MPTLPRCAKGTRRNRKTGICEPYAKKGVENEAEKGISQCPIGTRKNRKTGDCEPHVKKGAAPEAAPEPEKEAAPEPEKEAAPEPEPETVDTTEQNQDIREQCNFETTVYEPLHPCNQFLIRQENDEREGLASAPDSNNLYPTMNDPNFSLKIANKREFHDTMYDGTIHDVEARANELEKMDFELSSHQLFVKNFLSSHTPYNSLLLFHGLGTGKTCSAIGICEEHRDYIRQTGNSKKILVVASPNVQDNFRLQLFNASTMTNVNGEWFIKSCIGNKLIREINPTKTLNVSKERTILQINRIINESYEFMGYREFANYIEKRQKIGLREDTVDNPHTSLENIARMKRNLKEEFEGRLLCIDEVHNIRNADDSGNKMVVNQITFLVKSRPRLKLLLLSGTPMFNTYKEIIWLTNLMNMNDGRGLIKMSDVFNATGDFQEESGTTENGREVLVRKLTGYVSFVRGENPYTFPYRMYPGTFAPEQTFQTIPQQTKSIVGGEVVPNRVTTITDTNIYVVKVGEYQEDVYNRMTPELTSSDTNVQDQSIDENDGDAPGADEVGRLGYTRLQDPIQCLNMTYPLNNMSGDLSEDVQTMVEDGKVSVKDAIGTRGLKATMDYIDDRTESSYMKGQFAYKPWIQNGVHKDFFSSKKVGNYSGKIKQIVDCVIQSTGVVLIYSQYLDGGLIPMALALESIGITRHGSNDKSLFTTPPVASLRIGPKNLPAKYIMITGDKRLSPGNAADIIEVTKDDNLYGDYIKVVLVSMAGSEGVDLKFIRQVHILEPWYNRNRIEQIEGRAVRHNSHKLLPFQERNVQVFLYGSSVRDESLETVDMYVYRNAESKAVQIGKVTRVLKELSVDCFLNHSQTNFSVANMNQSVEQVLSSGKVIHDFKVGDNANTMLTDFMEDGEYKCYSQTDVVDIVDDKLNSSTYGERFIMLNTDRIIQKIRGLFKERHFYKKSDLKARLIHGDKHPLGQVYAALTILVDTDTEYITDAYGRSGRLVNIGDYYLFQPIELMDEHIPLFERSVPMQFKHDKLKIKMDINTNVDDVLLRAASQSNADVSIPVETVVAQGHENVEGSLKEGAVPTINIAAVPSSHAPIDNGDTIISRLHDAYNDAIIGFDTTEGIPRGNPNVYKYFGTAMSRMVKTDIVKAVEEPIDSRANAIRIIKGFLIDHLMDSLLIGHKITLLHYVFAKNMTDPNLKMKERIKKWFIAQQIETTGDFPLTAILFYDTKSKKGVETKFYIREHANTYAAGGEPENYTWTIAQPEDVKDLNQHLGENATLHPEEVSDLFGFNGDDIKKDNIIFKLKDATNKRSKGHRCSEMKKDGKIDILKKLIHNDVIEKLKYVKKEVSYHVTQEACVYVDFTLRYYDSIKKDGKRWFFSYNEHHRFRDILKV
jgi:hypothetical protein